jgi:hypothetical protein
MSTLPMHIAETQHGLVTTGQLRTTGFTNAQIRWTVTDGRLIRLSPRLFRVRGAPETTAQRVLAAVLDAGPGSALSHASALGWWDVPGFPLDELDVTHERDGVHRPARLAQRVHDVVLLPDHHVRTLDSVPVVVPARALFDIAGQPHVHPKRVERAVDNAWARRLVSGAALRAMLDELAQRGRPGIRLMRELLKDRGRDYVPPASGLEGRVDQILRDAGQRPLRRQVDAGDDVGWIGRVDFADDEVPFLLEVQSERFHRSLVDERSDRVRLDRLAAAGFEVATVTDIDVWHRTWQVVHAVRDGRLRARARKAARTPAAA